MSFRFFSAGSIVLIAAGFAGAEQINTIPKSDRSELPPLASFKDCDACPEMIVIPPGSFMMGAIHGESKNPFEFTGENPTFRRRGEGEINIIPYEHPRHLVEMDIPYAMARNEITHAQWMACVEDGGCTYVPYHRVRAVVGHDLPLGPNHPVINVSLLDVQEYVDWLNRIAGAEVYRLPTEAEWEYAARAGTETPFAQGEELTAEQANFSRLGTERSLGKPQPQLVDRETPVAVDELDAANAWGLRHMSGNVDEITLSCWTPTHIGLTSDSAYLAYTLAQGSCQRVAKGGSFNRGMDMCRLAVRTHPPETARTYYRGFRIVRETK